MIVYTPNRKITNLTAATIDGLISDCKSLTSNTDYGVNLWRARLPATTDWTQIEFEQFIGQINKGLLMPLWARVGTAGSEALSANNRKMTGMVLRPLWLQDSYMVDGANVSAALFEQTSGVDEFPMVAKLALPTYYNGAHTAAYQLVGAIGWSVQTAIPMDWMQNYLDYGSEYLICDVPHDRERYKEITFNAVYSNGGEIVREELDLRKETYMGLADSVFTDKSSPDQQLHQPFLIFNRAGFDTYVAVPDDSPPINTGSLSYHLRNIGAGAAHFAVNQTNFTDTLSNARLLDTSDTVLDSLLKLMMESFLDVSERGTLGGMNFVPGIGATSDINLKTIFEADREDSSAFQASLVNAVPNVDTGGIDDADGNPVNTGFPTLQYGSSLYNTTAYSGFTTLVQAIDIGIDVIRNEMESELT